MSEGTQEPSAYPSAAPSPAAGEAEPLGPDPGERSLHPAVVRLWRAGILLRTVGWAIVAVVLERVTSWPVPWTGIAIALLVAGGVLALTWPPKQYRSWAFCTRKRDLYVRSGVLWRSVSVIPYSRIQHVDTRNGPLERWLGLARLVVYTAGIRGADVTIPGLAADEAQALRERLAAVGGGEDAV